MATETTLDVEFCRHHFPTLQGEWAYFENAGGTLVPSQVIECLKEFTTNHQVQPGEGYEPSAKGAERIEMGRTVLADLINAHRDEIVVGPSTTSNVYTLSHALKPLLQPGDEIVVTNQDHEANNGAWRALDAQGILVREWRMNLETEDLELEDLEALLSDKTKLVCFTHCSNIVGLIHDVKAIVARIHHAGALACVDGVAMIPHRRVDVKDLDVDIYLYSPYKVFGPHLGVMYAKQDLMRLMASQSHYFLADDDFQRRLCPGGLNYELTAASAGIAEYMDAVHAQHYPGRNVGLQERLNQVFDLFARHEAEMSRPIEEFLLSKPNIRLVGERMIGKRERVGVFSFSVEGRDSKEIPAELHQHQIGLYADDFYAARCIDALGARPQNGFIRASLVHYNSAEDVERLIGHLDKTIS